MPSTGASARRARFVLEQQVARLLMQGKGTSEIALELGISQGRVRVIKHHFADRYGQGESDLRFARVWLIPPEVAGEPRSRRAGRVSARILPI